MDILIIGAGAVGQVYGRHLARAGHAITFFVKPAHEAALVDGLALHRLGRRGHRSETWNGYGLCHDVDEVAGRRWDQVWLCVPSDALGNPLTERVVRAAASTTVVCLQPGPDSADRVRSWLGDPDRLVLGYINFISYQSPLPGRPGPDGVAYFLSRWSPGLFSGASGHVAPVLMALREGGIAARAVADIGRVAGGGEAVLNVLVAALESNDWRLDGFAGSDALHLGRQAATEVLETLAAEHRIRAAPFRLLLSPVGVRLLLGVAPRLLPLELEPYLAYHFGKVGGQTRQILGSYLAAASRQGRRAPALRTLLDRLA